ncbi:MAG: HD domain-containing protein [Armatimonadota bacterium]|nr:HD domain-containing protein [Armatimonadota bacterium]MDR5702119.1 HD domain-containing protein [Armatimonadota bacterium]MDR7435110.1 HD domain-containing protein [Armatimonadota bacterium]
MDPSPLSPQARKFLWIVSGTTLALTVATGIGRLESALILPNARQIAPMIFAIAAIVLGRFYPVCLGEKIRAQVSEIVTFAAILLFHPLTAALIAAMGCALYYGIQMFTSRWPPYILIFNTAQHSLATLLSGLAYHGFHDSVQFHLATPFDLSRLVAAATIYVAANWSLSVTFSGLVQGRNPLSLGISLWKRTWILEVSGPFLGVILAIVYLYAPIAAALLVIPFIAVHQSYQASVLLRNQTRETLELLADTVDQRDPYTYQHSIRVAEHARALAERLGLPPDEVDTIALAARVHDLGKIGVPDGLLLKPQTLTASELEEIRRHTTLGANIVSKLPQYRQGKECILYHHERYDGSGLFGLSGKQIPLGARIIAVADAFDAMTSHRPYRQALPVQAALQELQKEKGRQFDPEIVDVFIEMMLEREQKEPELVSPPHPSEPSKIAL